MVAGDEIANQYATIGGKRLGKIRVEKLPAARNPVFLLSIAAMVTRS